jgi:hypothetical protein
MILLTWDACSQLPALMNRWRIRKCFGCCEISNAFALLDSVPGVMWFAAHFTEVPSAVAPVA